MDVSQAVSCGLFALTTPSEKTKVLNTKTARFAFTGYALLVRGCGRRISGVGDRQVQRLHYHSVPRLA